MDLKEDIDKRLEAGFSKKEIISFFKGKGYTREEIQDHFPKIKQTDPLYIFILIWSTLISLGLLISNIYFLTIFSVNGLVIVSLCVGLYLMYKMNKIGYIIHMVFYALLILIWLIAYIYYKGDGPDLISFSFWSFMIVFSIGSFFIRSLHSLYKKC